MIDSAIDKYLPGLLYCVVKSMELTYSELKNASIHISNDAALKVLDKLLSIIESKTSLFFKTNDTRRKPPEFGKATIKDIAIWLLSNSKKVYRPLANRCFVSFVKICRLIELENGNTADKFVQRLIENNGIDNVILKYVKREELSFDVIDVKDFNRFFMSIQSFHIEFDIYVNILKSGIFPLNMFVSETLNLKYTMSQFEFFLQFFTDRNFNDVFDNFVMIDREIDKDYKSTTILKHSFENVIFKTMWKFFEFSFYLNPNIYDIDTIKYSVSRALVAAIFDIHKFKIFKRNVSDDEIQIFFSNVQNKMVIVWPIFIELIFNKLLKMFQSLDINLSAESETTYEYLSILSRVLTSFDDEKKKVLFHHLSEINMLSFFDSLFITRNDGSLLSKGSVEISSLVRSLGYLLNFILELDMINLEVIINILLSGRIVANFDEKFFSRKNQVTYGEFCFEYFKNTITSYMIKNSEKFFNELYLSYSNDNKFLCIKFIEQTLQYSSEKKISDVSYYQHFFTYLTKVNTIFTFYY